MDYVRKNNVTHQVGTRLPSTYPSSRVTYGNNSNVEEQLNALNPSIIDLASYATSGLAVKKGSAVKIGNVVILEFYVEWSAATTASTVIFTLPTGFRPTSEYVGTGVISNDTNTYVRRSVINSSGQIYFSSTYAVKNLCGTIVYQVA